MRVYLMYAERDFDVKEQLSVHTQTIVQDLELETLFASMGGDDKFIHDVVKQAILLGLDDVDTIQYRQEILNDCLANPATLRNLYQVVVDTIENRRRSYFGVFMRSPSSILHESVKILQMFMEALKELRKIADTEAQAFSSRGFQSLFTMLQQELSDTYFSQVQKHLTTLALPDGVFMSAELGKGNRGESYTMLQQPDVKVRWTDRVFAKRRDEYIIRISDRDESGGRALNELRDHGLNLVANALAQSADHILSFFRQLQLELAFYLGCLNLYERLTSCGATLCIPKPYPESQRVYEFEELYDVCLRLTGSQDIVSNSLVAHETHLMIITGANQGGKSTFLRSLGVAQLMMQSGMFVAARAFTANVCRGIFTHFKREEDATMQSGKFDAEMRRMSDIADQLQANSMVLFNESFAATNEQEGSEIARQITLALIEKNVKVLFVTHMYEFAHGLYTAKVNHTMFLQAERQADGARTFKMIENPPERTSHGQDLFYRIFGERLSREVGTHTEYPEYVKR